MSQANPHPLKPRENQSPEPTGLGTYRTKLALDRTTLAWVRTTLAMTSFGFGMVAFFRTLEERSPTPERLRLHRDAIRMGTALMLVGIVATALAGLSHWSGLQRLRRGDGPVLSRWRMSLTVAMLVTLLGLKGLWELFLR
jgi:putative membrane protein